MKKVIVFTFYKFFGKSVSGLIKSLFLPSAFLRNKLRFIGKFKVKTRDGKSFYLYNNAFFLETSIFWLGINNFDWELMTRQIWVHLCQSSRTILDIGANTGIYATLAKVYSPNAVVYAFEPQPNIFNVLKKNNKLNNFDIHCEKLALSNQEGIMPFYNYGASTFTTGNTTAGSLNKDWQTGEQYSINVPVKELKTYVEANNIEKIDLIKIDVETYEYEVLSGYGKYLQAHQPIIILEIQNGVIGGEVKTLFDQALYSFFNIDEKIGLRKVEELGFSEENKNYLICPNTKLSLIKDFLFDNP
jgi:FkbM family methyltransferase